MKKVFFTAFAALAFAFTMTACGDNNGTSDSTDSNAVVTEKPCEHKCAHEGDTTACNMADTTHCCKAEGQECKHQCKEGQEGCKHQCKEGQEGCKHQCKEGEKKECCKK